MPDFGKFKKGLWARRLNNKYLILKVIFLLGFLLNYWPVSLIKETNFLKLSFVVLVTIFLFRKKLSKRTIFFVLFLPLVIFLHYGKNLANVFSFSFEEVYRINIRRGYYNNKSQAKILENKGLAGIYKYQKNFFQLIDINFYFFANHPRERVGVRETEKFHWLFLPMFIIGLYSQAAKKRHLPFIYFVFVLLITSFFQEIDGFTFLFLPFFTDTLMNGFDYLFQDWLGNKND